MQDIWLLLLPLALVAVLIAIIWPFRRIIILEYERGVKYHKGRFVAVLPPGEHWIAKRSGRVDRVDIRPSAVSIPGQEVLSSDGVSLKLSVAAIFEIVSPEVAINQAQNYMMSFYLAIQVALREVVGSTSIDDLLQKRGELGRRVFDLASPEVEKLGIRLVSASIKDIMFPGDIKKVFLQTVKARNEGAAALEKARAETAALRSLANAARMVESSPALMQLRMMHSIGESTGNTFVVGMPTSVVPVPGTKASASREANVPPDKSGAG